MPKRVSIQGKGAEIFFGEYEPQAPPAHTNTVDESSRLPVTSPDQPPPPRPRVPASPSGGASAPPGERVREGVGEHTGARTPGGTSDPLREPPKTRVFSMRGRAADGVVRHSHDLYRDQILWLNRLKLDLEVEYGQKVNGNDLVQLAVDLLRDDYEVLGEGSNLVSVLVFGQPRRRPRARAASATMSRKDGPDGS